MKILLSGGGTMGSVTPLLAVATDLQKHGHSLLFVGTKQGPEREVVENMDIPFYWIPAAKLRRYLTPKHLFLPLQIIASWSAAYSLLKREQPDVIVSAGGFVSVPLVWIGRWRFGIPALIHQQDIVPGLANRLMALTARTITVTFPQSLDHFEQRRGRKSLWIGNPTRDLTPSTLELTKMVDASVPTVLVMGGGTGAQGINDLVSEAMCTFANVIHITGRGKAGQGFAHPRYHQFEFLDEELKEALALSNVVVSRAGLGSITELAVLQKPTIFIPMPESHQEENAQYVQEAGAGEVYAQSDLTPETFAAVIQELLKNPEKQQQFKEKMKLLFPAGANAAFVEAIEETGKN